MQAPRPPSKGAIPEFGEREDGFDYPPRPGAYAILRDSAGRIAALLTPRGHYLPGGGIDARETAEDALRREVREECGGEIRILRPLGEAIEYVHTPGEPHGIAKQCLFFAAEFIDAPDDGKGCEPDHVLVWLTAGEAVKGFRHGSQRWAVQNALATEMAQEL